MVQTYVKGISVQLGDEYDSTMFDCECTRAECTTTLIDDVLIDGLSKLSIIFPIIHITSGFRCESHNKDVGGAAQGYHPKGQAADIETPFARPLEIKKEAEKIPCFAQGGIGTYSDGHLHVDTRGFTARW